MDIEQKRAEALENTYGVAETIGSCVSFEGGDNPCLILVAFGEQARELLSVVHPLTNLVQERHK